MLLAILIKSALVRTAFVVLTAASVMTQAAEIRLPEAGQMPKVILVYVGADNCAPCKEWQRVDGAYFRESTEFAFISYREVKSPTLMDVLKDENWPEDLVGYREAIQLPAGVPLWLLVANDRVVAKGFGLAQWRQAMLPQLRTLLRQP